jgi:hypothetical protein
MPEDENTSANPPEGSPPPESAQRITETQGERALKALIGSGAAEFPMDVQMANMEPAGGEPPPPPPPPPPETTD